MGKRRSIQLQERPAGFLDAWNVSRESSEKLGCFVEELAKWQRTHNLFGPAELETIWTRHLADGLQLADFVPDEASHIVDIGSGGGVPAIPLAIALQDGRTNPPLMTMVESNQKKSAFLRAACRASGIHARIVNKRIQSLNDSDLKQPVDVVTARALAPLSDLLGLVEKIPGDPQRMLFLKGQHIDVELTEATKCWSISFKQRPSKTSADGRILEIQEAKRVQQFNGEK